MKNILKPQHDPYKPEAIGPKSEGDGMYSMPMPRKKTPFDNAQPLPAYRGGSQEHDCEEP